MPVYLAHGFRWPRDGFTGIRVHAIVHNLEDVSVEYVQNTHSRLALAESLRKLYPATMQRLERAGRRVDFLEQYDPTDISPSATTQPYAFVCDRVAMIAGGDKAEAYLGDLFQTQAANASKAGRERPISIGIDKPANPPNSSSPERSKSPQHNKARAKTMPMSIEQPFNSPPDIRALSANVHDVTNDHPIPPDAWDALAELRDQLAKDEKIGWWVVYNGDPERAYESSDEEHESKASDVGTETGESMEEGVKELRPKVSASGLNPQPTRKDRALPVRSSGDQTAHFPQPPSQLPITSKITKPMVQPLKTDHPPTASINTPVRSPTGGRIPPPVPPPPPKSAARSPRNSQVVSQTATIPAEHVNMNKELPLSPVAEKDVMKVPYSKPTQLRALPASNGTPTGMRTPNMTLTGKVASNKGLVERDPSMQIEKAGRESLGKKETLRRKFFGKRTGSQGNADSPG